MPPLAFVIATIGHVFSRRLFSIIIKTMIFNSSTADSGSNIGVIVIFFRVCQLRQLLLRPPSQLREQTSIERDTCMNRPSTAEESAAAATTTFLLYEQWRHVTEPLPRYSTYLLLSWLLFWRPLLPFYPPPLPPAHSAWLDPLCLPPPSLLYSSVGRTVRPQRPSPAAAAALQDRAGVNWPTVDFSGNSSSI